MSPQPVRFGRYLLDEPLARGGMAEVFRASYVAAAGVTKKLVIKKILPHMAGDKNFISMFIAEAKLSATFTHGNVVQVFDFGEVNGEYFIAMEYVEGISLSQLLKRAAKQGVRMLPAPFAAAIAMEACKGLHYAHTRQDENGEPFNVVHRDVTPENILISYEGQVKVADFGVAKARVEGRRNTEPGLVKGKVLYLSPEQARGEPLDARTDVFALGVCLFRMLCGKLPFTGDDGRVMTKIALGDVPRPSSINPLIDVELERIVIKAMAPAREDRFESANALLHALSGWMGKNAGAHPPDGTTLLISWLCEDELIIKRGKRPVLPASFKEDLALWKQGQQDRSPDAKPTREMRSSAPTAPAEVAAPRKTPPWTIYLGVALAAIVAVAVLAVVIPGAQRPTHVTFRTKPRGAAITIDGIARTVFTPATIELDADVEHQVRLAFPGFDTWTGTVVGKPGEGKTVAVELNPEHVQPAPVAETKVLPEAKAAPVDAQRVPAALKLLKSAHAVQLPNSTPSFAAWEAGEYSFELFGEAHVEASLPWLEGAEEQRPRARTPLRTVLLVRSGSPEDVVALTAGTARRVKLNAGEAVRLFLILDDRLSVEGKGLHVRVRSGSNAIVLDSWPTVIVPPSRLLRVREVDPKRSHTLTASKPNELPGRLYCTLLSEKGAPQLRGEDVANVGDEEAASQLLISSNVSLQLQNVDSLWCAMLDLGQIGSPSWTVTLNQP